MKSDFRKKGEAYLQRSECWRSIRPLRERREESALEKMLRKATENKKEVGDIKLGYIRERMSTALCDS